MMDPEVPVQADAEYVRLRRQTSQLFHTTHEPLVLVEKQPLGPQIYKVHIACGAAYHVMTETVHTQLHWNQSLSNGGKSVKIPPVCHE